MRRITLAFAVLALVAGAMCARAGDMTLTKDGSLYRLGSDGEQLVLTLTAANGTVTATPVPQTAGIQASGLQVGVDEATATVVTAWQQGAAGSAQVLFATYNAGAWQGPVTLAGDDGVSAANPVLLVRRVTTVVEEEGGPVAYSTTLANVAWWQGLEGPDHGYAVYAFVPLEDDGTFDLGLAGRFPLSGLVPYGLACGDVPDPSNIAQPHLVVDPATGDPRVLAVDLSNCLFYLVELQPVLGDPDPITKRRRHTIIFGYTELMTVNPAVPLSIARMDVGRDLSVVLYWDTDTAVSYAQVKADGWSPILSLPVTADLSRERAVELVRDLAK